MALAQRLILYISSSDEVLVGFAYHVSEKKSETDTALWIHK
jgi:hypothetical protein